MSCPRGFHQKKDFHELDKEIRKGYAHMWWENIIALQSADSDNMITQQIALNNKKTITLTQPTIANPEKVKPL
jgi:hypothetical protein